ncbi:TPA: tail fiber assembly protein [Aeromonas sobria]|nr:tail fiber assembly protein [Aeromonas sobria]
MTELNEPRVSWDADGWAENSGWARAYCADVLTAEYIGPQDKWVSVGTGLPAGAYLDAPPPCATRQAVVRNESGWRLTPDYRGVTVYDKATRHPCEITELGPLPVTHTLLAPTSPYDVWDETTQGWIHDDIAAEQAQLIAATAEQAQRMAEANQQIAILQPAVDGGYAKPEYTQLLADWQRYRYELTLVPEQAGWPESPQWPTEPDKVI